MMSQLTDTLLASLTDLAKAPSRADNLEKAAWKNVGCTCVNNVHVIVLWWSSASNHTYSDKGGREIQLDTRQPLQKGVTAQDGSPGRESCFAHRQGREVDEGRTTVIEV